MTFVISLSGCIQPKHFGTQSTGTVGGRIIDGTEKTPIAAATITELSSHTNSVSAPDGSFTVALTNGPHHLAVQASGYADTSFDVVIRARSLVLATRDGYVRMKPLASH